MGTLINLDIYLATLEEDCELKQFNFKFTDKDERGTISFIHDIDMEYIDPLVDAVEFIIAIFNPTNLEDKIKTDDVEWMFGDDTTIVIANDETKESVKITFGSKNRKMNATINLNNDQTYITNMGGMIKDNAISMHSSFLIKLKCPTIYEQFFNNLCVFDYNDRIVAVSDMELLYTEYNVSDMGRSLSKKYGELVGGMVFVGLHEHMIIVTNLDKEEINDAESIVGILVKVIPKHHMKSVHLVNCPPTEDEDGNVLRRGGVNPLTFNEFMKLALSEPLTPDKMAAMEFFKRLGEILDKPDSGDGEDDGYPLAGLGIGVIGMSIDPNTGKPKFTDYGFIGPKERNFESDDSNDKDIFQAMEEAYNGMDKNEYSDGVYKFLTDLAKREIFGEDQQEEETEIDDDDDDDETETEDDDE